MKKVNWFFRIFLVLIMVQLVIGVSCKKDDDDDTTPDKTKFEVLGDYLTANNMDLSNMLDTWIVAPSAVNGNEASFYIMVIRDQTAFEAGHVIGAHNVALTDVVAEAANAALPILVICKTGQSAGHAVIALRLSGHADAQVMKWGMSGWTADFDLWTGATANIAVGNAEWVTTATATPAIWGNPTITTSATDGAGILAAQVTAMLAGGFKGVVAADVLAAPASYYINNYWAEADVTTYGHINGCYRISPMKLADGDMQKLDPAQTIVTYCWTGQTSSMITAYLTVLGFDAKSLKFGANAMIWDALTANSAHNWVASEDYTYVTGP